ncbi:MAG: FAD-dependent monooxygenase [Azospirillaceae bacterium]
MTWSKGRVFFDEAEVYRFDLLPESGHKRPAFINLQQYYLELFLHQRLEALRAGGAPVELRGRNRLADIDAGIEQGAESVALTVETPEGPYRIDCDWLIACDGAASPTRSMLGLDFVGRVFEDNFLIADVKMQADFPTERWFWFDPPFNRGQSALLHKQPDDVWRIDLQLGWDIDKEAEKAPERVIPRLRRMLGEDARFDLEWVSIYTFQCRRMARFRHGRVIFAGDAAHQVSPFGARGANSGFQDTDNLAWKLALVLDGLAPASLLDSYDRERIAAADENIVASTRSTDFITPKSATSRLFRDALLDLAPHAPFARAMVNSGRLSVPAVYDGSPLNGADDPALPDRTRPGAPCPDAPLGQEWLLDHLGGRFVLLGLNVDVPEVLTAHGVTVEGLALPAAPDENQLAENQLAENHLAGRYLGDAERAVYLIRPDQHVAARWRDYDEGAVGQALARAIGLAGAKG